MSRPKYMKLGITKEQYLKALNQTNLKVTKADLLTNITKAVEKGVEEASKYYLRRATPTTTDAIKAVYEVISGGKQWNENVKLTNDEKRYLIDKIVKDQFNFKEDKKGLVASQLIQTDKQARYMTDAVKDLKEKLSKQIASLSATSLTDDQLAQLNDSKALLQEINDSSFTFKDIKYNLDDKRDTIMSYLQRGTSLLNVATISAFYGS